MSDFVNRAGARWETTCSNIDKNLFQVPRNFAIYESCLYFHSPVPRRSQNADLRSILPIKDKFKFTVTLLYKQATQTCFKFIQNVHGEEGTCTNRENTLLNHYEFFLLVRKISLLFLRISLPAHLNQHFCSSYAFSLPASYKKLSHRVSSAKIECIDFDFSLYSIINFLLV